MAESDPPQADPPQAETPQAETPEPEELVDTLVEEVSIDGMCGVY